MKLDASVTPVSVCLGMARQSVRIRLTTAAEVMANELAAKWPMLKPNLLNQMAIEKGFRELVAMPTLLPAELAREFRRVG